MKNHNFEMKRRSMTWESWIHCESNLGGFARNTWLADRTRQCVSRPFAVIIRMNTRRSSCVPKCVLFGVFLLVGFNTQGVPCCLLLFCIVSLSVFRLVVEIVALLEFSPSQFQ